MQKTIEYKIKIEYKSTEIEEYDKIIEDQLGESIVAHVTMGYKEIPISIFVRGEGDGVAKILVEKQ